MTARLMTSVAIALAILPSQTPRDVRDEPKGTAIIAGTVTASDTGRPLRLSQVRLSGDTLLTSRALVTGADGRFEFGDLAAGHYAIEVYHAGFVRTQYGAKRSNGPGTSLVVTDGQHATDLVVRLTRSASINGTVYDQSGEPVPGISVEALEYTMRTGVRTLSSVYGSAPATDDRGIYRYSGLVAGDYLVAAGPGRAIGGVQVLAATDIDRALQAIASGQTPVTAMSTGGLVTFAPVYFPGTLDLANAETITLKDGEDRSGIDLHLQFVPTARLEGTIVMPDGQPAANVPLAAKIVGVPTSLDLFRGGDPGTARSDAQGRFNFPFVAPGTYEVTARVGGPPPNVEPFGQTVPSSPGLLFAQSTVTVAGSDQTVSLALQPGVTVAGAVVFNGTAKPPADMRGIRVTLAAPAYAGSAGATATQASPDGTFRISGVAPGRFRLAATVPGSSATSGWALRSAMVPMPGGPVDALDAPIDIRLGMALDNVVITFTDRPAELSGALATPPGVVPSDYFIIVFATDRREWGAQSRRTVMARPTTAGKYSVRNVPPGEYYVAAVTDVMPNEWYDSSFLDALVAAAAKVTITEAEQKVENLRIGG
jgi:hypothetical protein